MPTPHPLTPAAPPIEAWLRRRSTSLSDLADSLGAAVPLEHPIEALRLLADELKNAAHLEQVRMVIAQLDRFAKNIDKAGDAFGELAYELGEKANELDGAEEDLADDPGEGTRDER